jgi:hypothetical protein
MVGTTFFAYCAPYRAFRPKLFDRTFAGYCLVSAFAQGWSIFSGLQPFSNFCLLGVTLLVSIPKRHQIADDLRNSVDGIEMKTVAVLAAAALAVAQNMLTADRCYDNSLYHWLSARWVAEYGAVPGLANLHGRLGFNSSLGALSGILGVPFGEAIGREFANGTTIFLVVCVLGHGLSFDWFTEERRGRGIYAWGLLTFLLALVFSPCLSSPQPDVGSAAVAVAAAWYFFEFLTCPEDVGPQAAGSLFLTVAASVVAFELKLAYICFAAVTALIALAIALLRSDFRHVRLCLYFSAAIFLPWLVCGYITSGCPFFPSEIGRLNFDWSVPHALAALEKDAAFAWARAPELPISDVLGNWGWIIPWAARLLQDPFVIRPLLLAAIGLFMIALRLFVPPSLKIKWWLFFLMAPAVSGLMFWFFTAPDPRFAQATIWVFGFNVLLLSFLARGGASGREGVIIALLLAALAAYETGFGVLRLLHERKRFPNSQGKQPELLVRYTDSGLAVWVPKSSYAAGSTELVSTPADRFNPRLELRGSSLRDGFRIKE